MKAPAVASEKPFAVLFSRLGLWSLGEYWLFSGGHDFSRAVNGAKPIRLQPLKKSFSLFSLRLFSHAATQDEGLP